MNNYSIFCEKFELLNNFFNIDVYNCKHHKNE